MRLKKFNESVGIESMTWSITYTDGARGESEVLCSFSQEIYAADYVIKWTNDFLKSEKEKEYTFYNEVIDDGLVPECGYFEPFFDENGKSNFFHESSGFNLKENEDWSKCKNFHTELCDWDYRYLTIQKITYYTSPYTGKY
jgi:hypothetical protein